MKPPIELIQLLFQDIQDPRRSNANKRHELLDILTIALCGMLSSADDWNAIADYGVANEVWFTEFLSLPNGIPTHDTFNRVFSKIDPDQFVKAFIKWTAMIRKVVKSEVIAIDGKTLRRSFNDGNRHSAIHMVSAWATQNNLVLGQIKTEEKSNEITAIPELLSLLDIKDCLITIDAMGCQKKIADCIIEKEADYLLAVKDNQKTLKHDIESFFDTKKPKKYKRPEIDFHQTSEKNRSRKEIRRCWTHTLNSEFSEFEKWTNIKQIVCVESERTTLKKTSVERRFYITSSQKSAEELLAATRAHWRIENTLHWVLDMGFREDESRVRKQNGAENLSRLRHFALNILKQETTCKMGIKNRRKKAGYDQSYLYKLLDLNYRL